MTHQQWLFSYDEWAQAPSMSQLSLGDEALERKKMCAFIDCIGKRLQLDQDDIRTAKALAHRFYMRHSFRSYNYHEVGATILALMGKVGCEYRGIDHVAKTCVSKRLEGEQRTKEMDKWIECIMSKELIVLESLAFDFSVEHPHSYALDYVSKLYTHEPCYDQLLSCAFMYCDWCLDTPIVTIHTAKTMGMIAAYVAADAYGLKWPFGNLKDEFLFKDVNMALNLLHHEKEYKRFLDKGALGPQRISRLVTEETQRRERENARSSYYSQAAPISPLKSPQPSGASVPPAKEKSQTVSPKWLPTPTYAQGNQKPASVYSHHRSHGDAINGFKDASETNDQPPPPGSTARPSYMMPSQSHVLPPTSLPYPGSQTSRPGSYCKARPAYATHGYHPYNVQARIHPARHTPVGHLHQPPPPVGAPPVQPPPPPPVSVLESDTHRALENQVSAAL